ncbi:hypothetical protein MASR2M69_12520 [Bacteroidota bacterium]
MKTKIDINDPRFKENPFTVPEGYFVEVREAVSNKISSGSSNSPVGLWSVVKPQLSLVSAFVLIFFIVYGAFTIFSPEVTKPEITTLSANTGTHIFEGGYLKTSFIDFFDAEADTLINSTGEIDQEDLITYISENVDIVTLASIE